MVMGPKWRLLLEASNQLALAAMPSTWKSGNLSFVIQTSFK
jgi:hypothetical protein